MPVTVIAGYSFTVHLDTGVDATVQIKNGTIARAVNVINEKTLGPNTTPQGTDVEDTVSLDGLYDGGAVGWYDAVWQSTEPPTALDVTITDGQTPPTTWDGALMCSAIEAGFGAETSAESAATFTGRLTKTTA